MGLIVAELPKLETSIVCKYCSYGWIGSERTSPPWWSNTRLRQIEAAWGITLGSMKEEQSLFQPGRISIARCFELEKFVCWKGATS